MGSATVEAVKEIDAARGRLERNIKALEERMPAPALMVKRAAGTIAGSGLAGTIARFLLKRARRRRRARKSANMPPVQIRPVIQVIPENGHVVARSGDPRWLLVLAGAAGWAIARVMERRRAREADVVVDVTDAAMDSAASAMYAGE